MSPCALVLVVVMQTPFGVTNGGVQTSAGAGMDLEFKTMPVPEPVPSPGPAPSVRRRDEPTGFTMPAPAGYTPLEKWHIFWAYFRHMSVIWCDCRQAAPRKSCKNKCRETLRTRVPLAIFDVATMTFLALLLFFWFVLTPRLHFSSGEEMPRVTLDQTLDAVMQRQQDEVRNKPASTYRAPAWMMQDEIDWSEEDRRAYHTSLHRRLSAKLQQSMSEMPFHASLTYTPWALPADARMRLFRGMRQHLRHNPDECAVAAPSFRVYLNIVAVRWASLQSLPTYDSENNHVFLRNIHVTPVAPEGTIPPHQIKREHSNMCLDPDFGYVPERRYTAVWLTSDELPQGIILEGQEALCAQHFDDVFRGIWPCERVQERPRLPERIDLN